MLRVRDEHGVYDFDIARHDDDDHDASGDLDHNSDLADFDDYYHDAGGTR